MPETSSTEENRAKHRSFTGRDVCARCWRPSSGCYCAHIRPIATRTRLVLLQHPRERYVAIGTARMANLCLTNSELHVGLDWSRSAPLASALADPSRPPILLYPGNGAIDIVERPPSGPVTLVVIDGTWSQTKKVLRTNPVLAALPRYAFSPATPSEYRIRKEPDAMSVATIEALVHALSALEGDTVECKALLDPFRAMIDFQIECQHRLHGTRSRHSKRKERVRRMRVPRVLSDNLENVVCVAGEANSWPYTERSKHATYADELVQWAAYRPATGETLSFVVAPRGELAPGTSLHTGLDEATLRAGGSLEELHERWRAFVRPTDVVCAWGHYETKLFTTTGGTLPAVRVDLRQIARDVARGRVGALSDYRETFAALPSPTSPTAALGADTTPLVVGRAGRKLRAIADIVDAFARIAAAPQAGA